MTGDARSIKRTAAGARHSPLRREVSGRERTVCRAAVHDDAAERVRLPVLLYQRRDAPAAQGAIPASFDAAVKRHSAFRTAGDFSEHCADSASAFSGH